MTRPSSLAFCLSVAALVLIAALSGPVPADQLPSQKLPSFLAGALVVDVTPQKFPVVVNGSMVRRTVDEVKSSLSAREQVILHERQATEVVTQALRIGDIAIATMPTETYAITGLKIKAHSPLKNTMVIELANCGDGYIPPPERHLFGGYNTWTARSAGLEVMAEPKITESCHLLLEKVCKRPRRQPVQSRGPAAEVIARLNPHSWYRLDEFAGLRALDSSPNQRDGIFESHVTYHLAGPRSQLARWQWHHVALVCDGMTVRAYLHGKEGGRADLPNGCAHSLPLFLGSRSDNKSNWEGRLDELAFFERVLTTAEIAQLAGI